jgi:peptidoglycan hydrolase CwlO-like protein
MRIKKLLTIGFISLLIILFIPSRADAASCPDYMDPSSVECLDYLRDQLNDLSKTNQNIKSQLSNEEYKQLTLTQKIEYIENQINQTEKVIKSLEIEIAAHNIEISILEEDIEDAEDSIALSKQEITQLENYVNQRITESYKYSFIGALEIFLDTKNFEDVLRKTKYLISTRERDAQQLESYTLLVKDLEKEEEELSSQKAELQAKRLEMETQQEDLLVEKNNLDDQRDERARLLAESKRKAAELETTYIANTKKLADLDSAIIEYINKYGDQAVNSGYVTEGTWIGRMGNSGLSGGDHLHFSVNNGSGDLCGGNIYILDGYLIQGKASWLENIWGTGWAWPYVHAGTMRMPIAGPYVIMSQNYHHGTAIDLISYKSDYTKNWGAPIYAVMNGTLYKGVDGYGGKYAYILHDNGWRSCYLHLQ